MNCSIGDNDRGRGCHVLFLIGEHFRGRCQANHYLNDIKYRDTKRGIVAKRTGRLQKQCDSDEASCTRKGI